MTTKNQKPISKQKNPQKGQMSPNFKLYDYTIICWILVSWIIFFLFSIVPIILVEIIITKIFSSLYIMFQLLIKFYKTTIKEKFNDWVNEMRGFVDVQVHIFRKIDKNDWKKYIWYLFYVQYYIIAWFGQKFWLNILTGILEENLLNDSLIRWTLFSAYIEYEIRLLLRKAFVWLRLVIYMLYIYAITNCIAHIKTNFMDWHLLDNLVALAMKPFYDYIDNFWKCYKNSANQMYRAKFDKYKRKISLIPSDKVHWELLKYFYMSSLLASIWLCFLYFVIPDQLLFIAENYSFFSIETALLMTSFYCLLTIMEKIDK